MGVLQEMRRVQDSTAIDGMIDACIETICHHHLKSDLRAVFEVVAVDGSRLPGSKGRWICPGHMIEGGIFFIHEGRHRRDDELCRIGVDLVDWGFRHGWDAEFGGLYNDVDLEGLPIAYVVDALIADSKLWWQHAEALYGLLLAYEVSGRADLRRAHEQVHRYCFAKFADPEFGEWFGVLDRRGHTVHTAKGTARKNCFHIARNLFWAQRLCEDAGRAMQA
jgi:N-acylglucosamine 2-epimerase